MPGLILWFLALWVANANAPQRQGVFWSIVIVALLFIIVALWMTMLQLLGAARLQRMIEDLDRLSSQRSQDFICASLAT
jgi:hypothetical protein